MVTTTATTATSPTTTASQATQSSNALSSLTDNFQNFLSLLMTQLKNQDPTSPLDTNQFTTELVQFSSVEQQISTNTSLTQLIQLTQSGQMINATSIVGHQVLATGANMPLQNGAAGLQFTAASAEPVTISIYDSAGKHLTDSLVSATKGVNNWSWNGSTSTGATAPDGSYKVVVQTTDSSGNSTDVPFNVIGTVTSVQKSGTKLGVNMGSQAMDFSSIQSVLS